MTQLHGFETRLLDALSEIDAQRAPAPGALPHPAPPERVAVVRHRTRRRVALVVTTATLLVGAGAVATASGLFSAAPGAVKDIFSGMDGNGQEIDASKAVQIGVVDDHPAYAAPTENGGFCLYFAPNPRSGPNGGSCVDHRVAPDEVLFDVIPGNDGTFIFGRVGTEAATTVTVTFPDGAGSVSTPVGDSRFFLVRVPDSALRTLYSTHPVGPKDPPTKDGGPLEVFDLSRIADLTVVATDANGTPVAHGVAAPNPETAPTPTG